MGIRKQYDWVGENLSNPGFTNTDFKDNGINIQNTSIAPEEVYLNNPQIRQDQQFQTNGRFDPYKFHQKYVELAQSYNNLAKDTFDNDIKYMGRIFSEDNIFVSPEERRQGATTYMTLMDNPDHINYGIVGIDKAGPRTKTAMELAEGQPVYDSLTGKFTEYTAEDSFFKDFWRPMMLATYDENVDINGNPTDDESKIAHYKGERKLNEDGEYYLEYVNGKSTYGKELLSKWNILTKENSTLNKYDPFDSDDIKKSVSGSIARNALKILPLLTPVAPYYAAASIGINLVDALGTLGKLVMGSNNPTLNNITAFSESFNQTVSEEGLQKNFGLENVINMVGDTFMFLESQRILAEQAPKFFMKEVPRTPEEQKAAVKRLADKYNADRLEAIQKKYRELPLVDPARMELEFNAELETAQKASQSIAMAEVNNQINNFNKLGRQISTSMMAITFGLHTYGAAKAEEVSDVAATALTLGAIAGQYALLGSHIGQKIFPEATLERQQVRKALQEMLQLPSKKGSLAEETALLAKETTSTGKVKGTLSLMQKGKQLAEKIWGVNGSVMGTVAANTVATSIEMTSFTALDDIIASVYNLGAWLSGEDNRMSAWENISGRYGSSLLGGAIAGAMSAKRIYQAAQNIRNMQSPQALEIIAHMINEGKAQEIKKVIRENTWGNPWLSSKKVAETQLGNNDIGDLYGTGTFTDNQDLEAKQVMLETIDNMEKILTTYGAKIDSDSLLNVMVNGKNITHELRYVLLKESNVAQMYLKEFVQNQIKIYENAKKLSHDPQDKAEQGRTDGVERAIKEEERESNKNLPEDLKETTEAKSPQKSERDQAKEDLKDALIKNAKFMNGEMGKEFIDLALFEMQPGINMPYYDGAFREYVEKNNSGGKTYDEVTLQEKRKLAKEFYNTHTGELGMIYLRMAFEAYKKANKATSDSIKTIQKNSEPLKELQKLAEENKEFVRRELFLDKQSENASPYSLNTLFRPESLYHTEFVKHAMDKIWQDRQGLIEQLRKRYKGQNAELEKAIDDLISLHRDLNSYLEFLNESHKTVLNQERKLKQWELRKDAAEKAGEEFNEEKPEVPEFNSQFILDELSKAKGIRLAAGGRPDFEDRIMNLIQSIREKINNPVREDGIPLSPEQVDSLKSLYWTLTEPKALNADNYLYQNINGVRINYNTVAILQNLIEGLYLKTIGTKFYEEVNNILSNNVGFLDNETKDILSQVIKVLYANTQKLRNIGGLYDSKVIFGGNIEREDKIKDFSILEALELVNPEFAKHKEAIEQLGNEAVTPETELFFLPDRLDNLQKTLADYKSDVILEIADKLMSQLKFSDSSVTQILQALNIIIEKSTQKTVSIMTPSKVNTNEFLLNPSAVRDINNAILVLQMIRSGFVSADGEVRSSQNSVGFNPTANLIHNLTGDEAYAVLESSQVAEHVQYIQDTIYKLMYWREVAANAMKLRAEITDQADLGFQINTYSQITQRISALKESDVKWNNLEQFETEIGALSNLNNIIEQKVQDRITNQDDKVKDEVRQEYIQFKLALHDFLKANEENISDPKKLLSLARSFSTLEGNNFSAITLKDELNDDIALYYYIASIGALDPRVYYSNLKKSLSGQRQHLPVVVQNVWMYEAAAMALNKQYINKFVDALIEGYKLKHPDLESDDLDKKKAAQENYVWQFLATGLNPSRRNIYLVESGPGSGKTYGYLPELIALLQQIDPALDINKDLWIAGPEDNVSAEKEAPALNIRKQIGGQSSKVFTRDSLMEYILQDFTDYEEKFKVINGKINAKDGDGKPQVFNLDVNTGKPIFSYKLNEGLTELPKIIILDEISDYSEFDLDIIQDFANKHNITVLASGDFTQSGVYGDVQVKLGDTQRSSTLKSWSCQFIRSFKSQMSFRTTNTQSDHNNGILRTFFENYIKFAESFGTKNLELIRQGLKLSHYFDEESGNLYGTYIPQNVEGRLTDELKKYITGLYKSIENDPDKTVTLLYSSEDSEIFKFIDKHEGSYDWRKKTSFRKGTVLKGIESTYYIIDLEPNINSETDVSEEAWAERERVARELYTALTRQKQGAILVQRYRGKLPQFDVYGEVSESDTREISMSPEFIEKRNLQLAALLETMFPEVIESNKRIGDPIYDESIAPSEKKKIAEKQAYAVDKNYKLEDDDFQYEEQVDDATYSYLRQREEDILDSPMYFFKNGDTISYYSKTAQKLITIQNEGCFGLLNTFNALRTGFATINGNTVLDTSKDRRDNAHGIYYLARKGHVIDGFNLNNTFDPSNVSTADVEDMQTLLTRLSTIAKTRNNEEILKEFKKILGLIGNKNVYMRWIFAGEAKKGTDKFPRSDMFSYDFDNEWGFGGKGKGENNNRISRKELYLVIGEDDGEHKDILLTLPVATLPNYRTILNKNKVLRESVVGQKYRELSQALEAEISKLPKAERNKTRSYRSHEVDDAFAKWLLDYIQNTENPVEGSLFLFKLLDMWQITSEFVSFLPGEYQLAKTETRGNLRFMGPFLLTATRGFDYLVPGYEQDQVDANTDKYVVHDLADLSKDVDMSGIYTAQSQSRIRYTTDSGFMIKSGGYYVLTAPKGAFRDSPNTINERKMFNYFQKQLDQPETTPILVKLLNVRPPKSDIDSFMDSELVLLTQSPDKDTRPRQDIGNQFTAFRVLQRMFNDCEENGSDKLNNIIGSNISLRQGQRVNIGNVKEHVLRLTYLEGRKNPEKRDKLGKVYQLAEQELKPEQKKFLDDMINDPANRDLDFVALATRIMQENSGYAYGIRNSFRYVLLYMWFAEELKLPLLAGNTIARNYITEVLKDYSLLHNPAYERDPNKAPQYTVEMAYEKSTAKERFTFHKTNTDDYTGTSHNRPYDYKGKPFQYAAEIISGPMFGDITEILDQGLKGFTGVKNKGVLHSPGAYRFAKDLDAKDTLFSAPIKYFNPEKKAEIDNWLQGHDGIRGLALDESPYYSAVLGDNPSYFRIIFEKEMIRGIIGGDFDSIRVIKINSNEAEQIIANAKKLDTNKYAIIEVKQGDLYKKFLLSYVNDTSEIREIKPTSPEPEVPKTQFPWDETIYQSEENTDALSGTRVLGDVKILQAYDKSSGQHVILLTIGESSFGMEKTPDGLKLIELPGNKLDRSTVLERLKHTKELLLAENKDLDLLNLINDKIENILSVLRAETGEQTIYNINTLRESTDKQDRDLAQFIQEDLGITNIDFSAQTVIDTLRTNEIAEEEFADTLASILENYNVPNKFINELNALLGDNPIRRVKQEGDNICDINNI